MVCAATLTVTGCTAGRTPFERPSEQSSADPSSNSSEARGFDPPTRFDSDAGVLIDLAARPEDALLVDGTGVVPVRYRVAGSDRAEVRLIDLDDGSVRATIRPPDNEPSLQTQLDAEVAMRVMVARVAGNDTVLSPFLMKAPGSGTTPNGFILALTQTGLASGQTTKTFSMFLGPWAGAVWSQPGTPDDLSTSVLGVRDGKAVVAVSGNDQSLIFAVDLTSGSRLWAVPGFEPAGMTDGVVAGRQPVTSSRYDAKIVGLEVRTGRVVWTSPHDASNVVVVPGGPSKTFTRGHDNAGHTPFVEILDTVTGKVVTASSGNDANGRRLSRCRYDDASVAICDGGNSAGAFDTDTGKWLWSIDEGGGRLVPTIIGAWHGAVYARTTNGPVVLDARSGKDREPKPGVAVSVTSDRVGIGPSEYGPGAALYPAIG